MIKILSIICTSVIGFMMISCEKADSAKPWGDALIYMPQANYSPYIVPNNGSEADVNANWRVDDDRLLVFLGVYRSGLEELNEYTVTVSAGNDALENTVLLPASEYSLPESVTCEYGKRDVTFYLSINLPFLKNSDPSVDYSLKVTISSPTRYRLHENLATTDVFIDTDAVLGKLSVE